MATNDSAPFCDICQQRDLNKLAEEFCPQCEEALCGDCREHHKISKSTKLHQTISVENYNKLPSFIKQISNNCEEHGCFLEFHCKYHDCLCCKRCMISGHKECKDTILIEDFLTPSPGHQTVALENIEKVLRDLEINISSALEDRNRNLTELREQKRIITKQVKEKRQEINKFLDQLEEELHEKASGIQKECCQKIEEVIAKLNEEKVKADEIRLDLESVKVFASNLQIVLGTKAFQESVLTNEINIKKLYNNGSFNNLTMKCTFNEKLQGFMNEKQALGDMKISNCKQQNLFSWKVDQSAQLFKSISRSLENIKVRLVRKIIVDRNGLTGCAISEAGNLLFLQAHKNSLLQYARTGYFLSEFRINGLPSDIGYDLAVVDSNMVAVSTGGNYPHKICLIDMKSTETRQYFDLNDFSFGLSYHDGSLICCTFIQGIQIFNLLKQNLTYLRKLPNAPTDGSDAYVASNGDCIFCSNWRDHSVICYDYNGHVQWTYADSLLRTPYGITVDSKANVYVAGSESNNIVVISKDGKQAKELIGASDGLSNPRAIYFDENKNLLLVTNYNAAAFLFDVT